VLGESLVSFDGLGILMKMVMMMELEEMMLEVEESGNEGKY
jgi:hypothetical protein